MDGRNNLKIHTMYFSQNFNVKYEIFVETFDTWSNYNRNISKYESVLWLNSNSLAIIFDNEWGKVS